MKKIATLLLLLLTNDFAFSQWSNDPAVNTAICVAADQQRGHQIVSDGSGGAIITWMDDRDIATNSTDIYAQRINAAGLILWTTNGVAICTDAGLQSAPQITADGNGGAIIVWQDNRVFNIPEIFAQRINASGVVQWTTNGFSLGDGSIGQAFAQILSDGMGGAFVAWKNSTTTISQIKVQRINAGGVIQWVTGGVDMTTNRAGELPQIISDGAGGAIIAWNQWVGVYPAGNHDIYAQRVNASGAIQWGAAGVAICSAPFNQTGPQLTSDGNNGAIISWRDTRTGTPPINLFAQRVNGSGVVQWATDGVNINPVALNASEHKIISDGSGGAFITWRYSNNRIYAQRVNAGGASQWAAIGVSIGAVGSPGEPQIISDGGTGAIISFHRGGSNDLEINAQRINDAGAIQWVLNGVVVSNALFNQLTCRMVANGSGGAIIAWMDYRNNAASSIDIYAQQVNTNGSLGVGALPVTLLNFKANNQGNKVQLQWQTASEQNSHYFNIERSSDGIQFTAIGKVNAAANSTGVKNYSFVDVSPGSGINYYRLRQVDTDGKFTYSPVVQVENTKDNLDFMVSPNPANHFLNIHYTGKKTGLSIRLFNLEGRLVKQQIQNNEMPITIELNQLQPGMYFIQIGDGNNMQKGRFVKQ